MLDKIGPFAVWALFLVGCWLEAPPILVFVGTALIIGLVILGVSRHLNRPTS